MSVCYLSHVSVPQPLTTTTINNCVAFCVRPPPHICFLYFVLFELELEYQLHHGDFCKKGCFRRWLKIALFNSPFLRKYL